MPALDSLFPLIAPHAPACPNPTLRANLRLAAIEFCERTRCWRDRITTSIEPAPSHELQTPNFAVIERIEGAWLDDERLTPIAFNMVEPGEFVEPGQPGHGRYVTQVAPGTISVLPNAGGQLRLNVILKPPPDGFGFDQDAPVALLEMHGQSLAYGALARIQRIPGQSWTNPAAGEKHEIRFERAITRAMNAHFYGQHRPRPRTRASFL